MIRNQSREGALHDVSQRQSLPFDRFGQQRAIVEGDGTAEMDRQSCIIVVLHHIASDEGRKGIQYQTADAGIIQVRGQKGG